MARSEKGPPATKRKGGGIRQRIAAAEAVEAARTISNASSRGQSKLAKFLIESWAKGELSPQKVQHIAELAMCDLSQMGNVQFKTLEKLAALGHHGAAPQNCHRDRLALAKPYSSLPQQSLHCIHFKKKASSMQGIFLPHEIFASLFHDYQESWREVILPHPEKLKQFWEVAKNYPCMEDHPLDASQLQWAIPLSLHGDGFPTSGAGKVSCKMFTNFSWSSLLGEGSTALMQQYIWGVVDSVGGQRTLDDFFSILAWSFTCLFHGTWPAQDHLGQPFAAGTLGATRAGCQLAGGYRGILFGILGDLDYLASTLGLPRWSKKDDFCALCKPLGLAWEDFRLGACEWVGHQWHTSSWRLWPGKPSNALFGVPGVTALNVCYDYMHCKYLGTEQVLFGSCLYIHCNYCMDGSPEENVLVLWDKLKSFQKSSSVRHPCKFLGRTSMFTRKKGPHKLRGKAAEISCFGPAMLHLWELCCDKEDPWHKKIGIMLKLTNRCEDIIHDAKDDLSLDAQSSESLAKSVFALFHLQLGVAQHFREAGNNQLFTVTPKAHFLCHIALLSKFISPRLSWCFKGEAMMKKVRTLAAHCFKRLSAMEAPNKIARHYRIAQHFAMSKADKL